MILIVWSSAAPHASPSLLMFQSYLVVSNVLGFPSSHTTPHHTTPHHTTPHHTTPHHTTPHHTTPHHTTPHHTTPHHTTPHHTTPHHTTPHHTTPHHTTPHHTTPHHTTPHHTTPHHTTPHHTTREKLIRDNGLIRKLSFGHTADGTNDTVLNSLLIFVGSLRRIGARIIMSKLNVEAVVDQR